MTVFEVFTAVFTTGLPLFLLSFALVCLALRSGVLAGESVREIQDSIEVLDKQRSKKKTRQQMDPALGKWFSFGGGFYGLVALYTWLLIQWDDAVDFVRGLGRIVLDFNPDALLGLVIDLFIESLMNFVVAIGWPAYWLAESRDAWVLLFVAYGGYWLGIKAARHAWRMGLVDKAYERLREAVGGSR